MSKKLYVMISDGGDGSYALMYTLNPELVAKMQTAYDDDKMGYENGYGCDGDGFHYSTINVPDDATPESLGLSQYHFIPDDFADKWVD